MEKEMPIYNIEGTAFFVDVNTFQLKEVGNEQNLISCTDMADFGNGYRFDYNRERKNIPGLFQKTDAIIDLPAFTILDPEGMAKRFCLTIELVKATTDFELLVDPAAYDLRVNKGVLPIVNISGHTFYVDIRMDMLRPKDDFLSKGIKFSEIENYYDEDKRTYTIPYNPKKT